MAKFIFSIAVIFLPFLTVAQTTQSILDKYIKFTGGVEAWTKLQSSGFRRIGTYKGPDLFDTYSLVNETRHHGKGYKLEIFGESGMDIVLVTPKGKWHGAINPNTWYFNKTSKEAATEEYGFTPELYYHVKNPESLVFKREVKVNDRDLYELEVTYPYRRIVYFEKSTGALRWVVKPGREIIKFGNYEKYNNGVTLANFIATIEISTSDYQEILRIMENTKSAKTIEFSVLAPQTLTEFTYEPEGEVQSVTRYSAGDKDETTETILEKYYSAIGSDWNKINKLWYREEALLGKRTITTYRDRFKGYRMEDTLGMIAKTTLFNMEGMHRWYGDKPRQSFELADVQVMTYLDPRGDLFDYKKKGTKISYMHNEVARGRRCHKLKAEMADGEIRHYFIDTETSLPLRMIQVISYEGKTYYSFVDYIEYKEIHGNALMSHNTITIGTGQMIVKDVKVNEPISESIFK